MNMIMKILVLQIIILLALAGCSDMPSRPETDNDMLIRNPALPATITEDLHKKKSQAVNATPNSTQQTEVHIYPYATDPTIIASPVPLPNASQNKPVSTDRVRPIIHARGNSSTIDAKSTRIQTSDPAGVTTNTTSNIHSEITYITDTATYPQIPHNNDATVTTDSQAAYTDYNASAETNDSGTNDSGTESNLQPQYESRHESTKPTPKKSPPKAKQPSRPPLTLALITKPSPFFAPGITSIAPVKALLEQAANQRAAGNLVMAAGTLERSLRIEPRNPHLWNRLARIRLEQGLFSQATSLAAKSNTLAGNDEDLVRENKRIIGEAHKKVGGGR